MVRARICHNFTLIDKDEFAKRALTERNSTLIEDSSILIKESGTFTSISNVSRASILAFAPVSTLGPLSRYIEDDP